MSSEVISYMLLCIRVKLIIVKYNITKQQHKTPDIILVASLYIIDELNIQAINYFKQK